MSLQPFFRMPADLLLPPFLPESVNEPARSELKQPARAAVPSPGATALPPCLSTPAIAPAQCSESPFPRVLAGRFSGRNTPRRASRVFWKKLLRARKRPSWGHRLVEHCHAVTTIGKLHFRHHVGDPPQLFDLSADPRETRDLAGDPQSVPLLEPFERHLRTIVNPEVMDQAAKADQARRIEAAGGLDVTARRGPIAGGTPAPDQFRDA